MNVVMAFISDHVRSPEITTEAVYTYMKRRGYDYKKTDTIDAHRVELM